MLSVMDAIHLSEGKYLCFAYENDYLTIINLVKDGVVKHVMTLIYAVLVNPV